MKKKWILCLITFLIFVFILIGVVSKNIMFDSPIMNLLYNSRNDFLTGLNKGITFFGEAKVIVVFTVIMIGYFIIKKKSIHKSFLVGLNLVNIVILNQGIKFLIRRDRPALSPLIEESGYSFPSGHSMVSMGFYCLLIYLINKSNIKNIYKRILTVVLVALILLIGISRIYLGVHYPSDVIGGFALTLSYFIIFVSIINKYFDKDTN